MLAPQGSSYSGLWFPCDWEQTTPGRGDSVLFQEVPRAVTPVLDFCLWILPPSKCLKTLGTGETCGKGRPHIPSSV